MEKVYTESKENTITPICDNNDILNNHPHINLDNLNDSDDIIEFNDLILTESIPISTEHNVNEIGGSFYLEKGEYEYQLPLFEQFQTVDNKSHLKFNCKNCLLSLFIIEEK